MHRLLALLLLAGCRGEALAPAPVLADASTSPPCSGGELRGEGPCGSAAEGYVSGDGVTYVVDQNHPAASDANPGTVEQPWLTISRAAQPGVLRPGDAVLIREGVYRESVRPASGGTPAARVTFAAYPGETVVISGADLAPDGWARQPDGAWRRAWTGPSLPTYSDDPVFRREMVIAGGDVLRPVWEREDLAPGTFWVQGPETAQAAVYARFHNDASPDQAGPLEIAVRRRLFDPLGEDPYSDCSDPTAPGWFRVVGLTLRHAANRAQWGALCAGSVGSVVEDVTVEWTVGMGVDGSGRDHVFRRVRADQNGQAGWGASCVGCLFEDGAAIGNNWIGHDLFWEAGGGKWSGTENTVIRRHLAAFNDGPGIWLDGQNEGNTIEDCLVVGNLGAGIMLELETTATLVQNNVVARTRWRDWTGTGILSQAASGNVILHNTVVANEGTGVWIRLDPLRRAADGDNEVLLNWIVGNAANAEQEAREVAVEGETLAEVRSTRFDGNVYGVPSGDPVLRSTFFAAPALDGSSYRGNALRAWQEVVQGARQSRVAVSHETTVWAAGASIAGPRRPAGAEGLPVRRQTHAGAHLPSVRGAGAWEALRIQTALPASSKGN